MLTRLPGNKRRFTDRLEDKRQKVLAPDEPAAAIPKEWRDFVAAIADIPEGAEPNITGMRATARQLLGAIA